MLTASFVQGTSGRLIAFGLLIGAAIGLCDIAVAATHVVASTTASVDCRSFGGGVRPGDSLVLRGQTRNSISFSNCRGTASQPITAINDATATSPLLIRRSGSAPGIQCVNCEHFVIDGTSKWVGAPAGECGASIVDGEWRLGAKQCGIVVQCMAGSTSNAIVRFAGSSKHVTVKGLEIDGNFPSCTRGSGIYVNDHNYELADHPGEWREGFLLANNYIHDTGTTGIYFGPNQNKGGLGDLQVRNNEISNNYVNNTGCDGIKYKSAIMGTSRIHHNYVTNTGQTSGDKADGCVANGISLFEGGYTEIFANYVEAPSPNASGHGNCIGHVTMNLSSSKVSTVPVEIYNNVVRNCNGKGITSARGSTSNPKHLPTIYNNTIVSPVGDGGISVNGKIDSCVVRDNILAGTSLKAEQCATSRNIISEVATVRFIDAFGDDFRLTANSPAVDSGGSQCPREDHAGNERPQGGSCDQGAFELVVGQSDKPSPPEMLTVE